MDGSHSVWYGRAIRVYFGISLLISATWLAKIAFSSSDLFSVQRSAAVLQSKPVDNSSQQLKLPSAEYSLAFTDHIYCISPTERLGRRARMAELFKFMRLDGELFSGSHQDAWRDMIAKGHQRALVVEDDVDFEVDAITTIRKALASVEAKKRGWDILYVGHCSMEEEPTQGRVAKSVHPFCTSGYVISRAGAQKLLEYFSKHKTGTYPLDVQLVALVKRGVIGSFSVFPPVVFQRRDLYPSDDGMELRVARLFRNSAWDEAREFVPRLADWVDPPDEDR
ncbi:hypothetical protein GGF43_003360, partial [Coemansia sp. RSA 2618]